MNFIFFVQKKRLYKNFTRAVVVVVSCLFILKNQTKSLSIDFISTILHETHPSKNSVILTNFPNPFTDLTYIFIKLPNTSYLSQEVNGFPEKNIILIKIYDLLGNLVRSYDFSKVSVANNSFYIIWDGKDERGSKVSVGGYICVLYYNDIRIVRKIGLAK